MSDDKILGKVKWFNESKGYGIIEDSEGKRYFAHHTDLRKKINNGINFLEENQVVKFRTEEDDSQAVRAAEIEIL